MQLHNKAKDQVLNFLPTKSLSLNISQSHPNTILLQTPQLYERARSAQVSMLRSLTKAKHLNHTIEAVFQVLKFGPE